MPFSASWRDWLNPLRPVRYIADNQTALEEALKEAIEEEKETSICELLIEKLKNLKGSKDRKNKKKNDFTE